MDMNIQKYLAFVKAAELGSFSKAAEALSYSQSGISRMINDLEQDLGLMLLKRGKNGVCLTSDGQQLLPYAHRLCSEFQKLEMEAADLRGVSSGCIRIGTFSSVAAHWLPNIIRAFRTDYPGCEYEFLVGNYPEIEKWILDGQVDCGFLVLPTDPALEFHFLYRDRLMAVIPQDHPLSGESVFPVSALLEEPFMLLEESFKSDISRYLEKNNLAPDIRFTTLDDYAIMSMVESGLGISILPELILKRTPYRILAKPLSNPAYRDIGFVLRDAKSASAAVRKFMEYLKYR